MNYARFLEDNFQDSMNPPGYYQVGVVRVHKQTLEEELKEIDPLVAAAPPEDLPRDLFLKDTDLCLKYDVGSAEILRTLIKHRLQSAA
jgi:hypothetical protein